MLASRRLVSIRAHHTGETHVQARRLDGDGNEWTLAWDGAPSPATVPRALSHPYRLAVPGQNVGDTGR